MHYLCRSQYSSLPWIIVDGCDFYYVGANDPHALQTVEDAQQLSGRPSSNFRCSRGCDSISLQ